MAGKPGHATAGVRGGSRRAAGWIADVLARLQVRYPEIHAIFADSPKFAEEWTYRFLAAALAEATDRTPGS